MQSNEVKKHPQMLTTRDVAELFNVTPRFIRMECERGNIEGARKLSSIWRIPANSPYITGEAEQAAEARKAA